MINRSSIKIAKPGDQVLCRMKDDEYLGVIMCMDSETITLVPCMSLKHGTAVAEHTIKRNEILRGWFKCVRQPDHNPPATLEA